MSGICGFIDHPDSADSRALDITDMIGRMKSSPEDPAMSAAFVNGAMGAYRRASGHTGAECFSAGKGLLALSWDVQLINLSDLCRETGIGRPEGRSDTVGPLLAEMYSRYGDGMFSRLDGDFVVAIWDESTGKLIVATDRFRVKPVCYTQGPAGVRFASKLHGLVADPAFDRTVNLVAIADYLDTSVISTPETIYRNAWKLPPGCVLEWRKGNLSVKPYWDMRYEENFGRTKREFAQDVRQALDRSISSRLEGEGEGKEVGAFLSGGVDSTTIVGLLSRRCGKRLKAFSIGFEEQSFNEMEFARNAARHYGVEHHEYYVSPKDTLELIPRMAAEYDEPYANSSAVPTYYCARMALESGVSCIFAGDGGDELFAGNERYATDKLFGYYGLLPLGLRSSLIEPLVSGFARLPVPPFGKLNKYIRRSSIPNPERMFSYAPGRTIPMREGMFEGRLKEAASKIPDHRAYRRWYADAPAGDDLNRFMYIDLKGTISDNDLVKVTRMSELAGLKVHFPFLDYSLAELSGRIPAGMKMRGLRLRSFFKDAYADFLPEATRKKRKHGFGLPIPVWLRTDPGLKSMAEDLLLSRRSLERGYFQRPFVESILQRHRTDTTSFYGTLIWHLMMLELWHRT